MLTGKLKIWSYAKCGTCKKALAWLDAKGVEYTLVPIVDEPPSKRALNRLMKTSGLPLKRFFNTSGMSYRQGGFSEKLKTMTKAEALDALAADGKLIKRPLVDGGDVVLVGFKEAEYEAALG
ncbi:MAG: Spx/MgsR family RNA polymerase-binding regulatory protein [Myxococcota bacterium]